MKWISIGMFVLTWLTRASADGKITMPEIIQLVEGCIGLSGLKVRIDVPDTLMNQATDQMPIAANGDRLPLSHFLSG